MSCIKFTRPLYHFYHQINDWTWSKRATSSGSSRVVNADVVSLCFPKLIVVEGAGVLVHEGGGAVWSWICFEDQSSELRWARGRRQDGQWTRHVRRAEPKSLRNWIRKKKWCPDGALNNRNITCWVLFLNGLPKEYEIQSDCSIHEWILKVGVSSASLIIDK